MDSNWQVQTTVQQLRDSSSFFRTLHPIILFLLGVLAAAVLMGSLATLFLLPTIAPFLLAGIIVVTFGTGYIWNNSIWLICILNILVASFIPQDIFDIRLPVGGGLDLSDVIFIGALGILVIRQLNRKLITIPWMAVGVPLLLFLLVVVTSAFNSLAIENTEFNWVFRDVRVFIYFLLFFMIIWAIEKPLHLIYLCGSVFLIADLTTLIIIGQQFVGINNYLVPGMSDVTMWQITAVGDGTVRIMPPSIQFIGIAQLFSLCLIFVANDNRLRLFAIFQFLFLGIGFLLTYTRSAWAASGIGIVLIIVYYAITRRDVILFKIGLVSLPFLIGAAIGLTLLPSSLYDDIPIVGSLATRVVSIFQVRDTVQTYSIQWRIFENDEAIRAIGEKPILGWGLNTPYRNITIQQGEAARTFVPNMHDRYRFTRFVHNGYLAIMLKTGLLGFSVLMWMYAAFMFDGFRRLQTLENPYYIALGISILASFAGLLLRAYFFGIFTEPHLVINLVTSMGIVGAIFKLSNAQGA